jgi:plastocyanin
MISTFFRILGASILGLCFAAIVATTSALAGDLIITIRDADGAPVADAVVKVIPKSGQAAKTTPLDAVTRVNQVETEYEPFVSVITVGSKIEFTNSDDWAHHVYSFS